MSRKHLANPDLPPVFLSGPPGTKWRRTVSRMLGGNVCDTGKKADIALCRAVLVYAPWKHLASTMHALHAQNLDIPVIVAVPWASPDLDSALLEAADVVTYSWASESAVRLLRAEP